MIDWLWLITMFLNGDVMADPDVEFTVDKKEQDAISTDLSAGFTSIL